MTGAIALAIVLVVAVVGVSMALESQRNLQTPAARRVPRTPPPPAEARKPRERSRERLRERKAADPATSPISDISPSPADAESRGPELLRSGVAAEAKVISVVDERTIGPVTRSRLALRIDPGDGPVFEVTVRVAFQTPESRSRVKVGGTIPVRYDKDDRTRVVVDVPQE